MENPRRRFRTGELQEMGIATTSELVEAFGSADKRKELSALLRVSEGRIEEWLSLIYPNHKSAIATEVAGLLEHGGVAVLKPHMKHPGLD